MVGAGLALLYAPRSGELTRKGLADWQAARQKDQAEPKGAADPIEVGTAVLAALVERIERARTEAGMASREAKTRFLQEWEDRKAGRDL